MPSSAHTPTSHRHVTWCAHDRVLAALPYHSIESIHPPKTGGGTVETYLKRCQRFVIDLRLPDGRSHHYDYMAGAFAGRTTRFNVSLAVVSLRDPAERVVSQWMMVHGALSNKTMALESASRSWVLADLPQLLQAANLRVNGRFKGILPYPYYFQQIAWNDTRVAVICTETLSDDVLRLRQAVCPELSGSPDEIQLKNYSSQLQKHVARSKNVGYNISLELRKALYAKMPNDKALYDHFCRRRTGILRGTIARHSDACAD
jgi:hypothetical protein